jgi:hypothetical protein
MLNRAGKVNAEYENARRVAPDDQTTVSKGGRATVVVEPLGHRTAWAQ